MSISYKDDYGNKHYAYIQEFEFSFYRDRFDEVQVEPFFNPPSVDYELIF